MNVLFDVSTVNKPDISGVGIYIKNLYQALRQSMGKNISPVIKPSRANDIRTVQKHTMDRPRIYWPFFTGGEGCLFHGPDFKIPIVPRAKTVVTIHDLAFNEPGLTSEKFAVARQQLLKHTIEKQNPDAIITVSHFTKIKLLEIYPQLSEKIYPIHLGADHLKDFEVTPEEIPQEKPYFLFVGNLEARKNIVGLLQSFDRFSSKNPHENIQLVLIGRAGFGFEKITEQISTMKFKDRVIFPGYVRNSELKSYYKKALGFVYPSYHEGFGIPVIEAMVNSCAVLTSKASATEEVAKDAALTVNPKDIEEICMGLEILAFDELTKVQLIKKAQARVEQFSWKKCARETRAVYEKVLDH